MSKRIAFFSFADIDNFGDILFSHIFQMEIQKRLPEAKIDFYSPSDFDVEGIQYISYQRHLVETGYDALILFGGEVIHLYDERTWEPIYRKKNQEVKSQRPSDTVFDWTDIPSAYKAWISVGVRPVASDDDYQKILQCVEQLDYVSVRGNLSKKILEKMDLQYNNSKIKITPDLGWLFPNILDYKKVRGSHYKRFTNGKYMVFQINNISEEEAEQISGYLTAFRKETGLEVILLPVIRPWEDFKYLEMIKSFGAQEFSLLPNDLGILEIADLLVHAELVLCSSLHAAITALSGGVPAGIINKWHGTKLQDLFGHQFRLDFVKHSLDEIPKLLTNLQEEKAHGERLLTKYSEFMKASLEKIFDQLTLRI